MILANDAERITNTLDMNIEANNKRVATMDDGQEIEVKTDWEAKRIACVAESMNIIRTLNSHKILFDVRFGLATILFEIADQDLKAFNIYLKHESSTVTVRHDNGLCAILLTW